MSAFSIGIGLGACFPVTGGDIPIVAVPTAPSVAGSLPDLALVQGAAPATVDAASVFRDATGGTWSVTGTGASITQGGLVTVTTAAPRAGAAVVVSYAKPGFPTVSAGFGVTVTAAAAVPAIFAAAMWSLADPATGGALTLAVTAFPATGGSPLTRIERRIGSGAWTTIGLPSLPYSTTLTGLTNGTAVIVQLRAVNAVGDGPAASLTQTPSAPPVPAPSVAGSLPDLVLVQGSPAATVNAAGVFRNATGGAWSVTGTGATVSAAGVVTVTTSALRANAAIAVSYAKPGFPTVQAGFAVSVFAAPAITSTIDLATAAFVAGRTVGSTAIYAALGTAGNYAATGGYAVTSVTRAITGSVTNASTAMTAGGAVTITATVTATKAGAADLLATFVASATVQAAPVPRTLTLTPDGQAEMAVNAGPFSIAIEGTSPYSGSYPGDISGFAGGVIVAAPVRLVSGGAIGDAVTIVPALKLVRDGGPITANGFQIRRGAANRAAGPVVAADQGQSLTVVETVTNADGTRISTSAPLTIPAAPDAGTIAFDQAAVADHGFAANDARSTITFPGGVMRATVVTTGGNAFRQRIDGRLTAGTTAAIVLDVTSAGEIRLEMIVDAAQNGAVIGTVIIPGTGRRQATASFAIPANVVGMEQFAVQMLQPSAPGTFVDFHAFTIDATPVAATAPINTTAPAITGTPQVGQTLTVTDGDWDGTAPITFTSQWKAGATNVGTGATTYAPVAADVGKTITCIVTASNGTAPDGTATSAATATVAAAAQTGGNNLLPFNDPNATGFSAHPGATINAQGEILFVQNGGSPNVSIETTALLPNTDYVTTYDITTNQSNRSVVVYVANRSVGSTGPGAPANVRTTLTTTFRTPASFPSPHQVELYCASSSTSAVTIHSVSTVPA